MSILLVEFTKSYIRGRLNTQTFVDAYMELWKIERDTFITLKDDDLLSEVLSSIFCVVDLYNPDDDKEEYEFDNNGLYKQIELELSRLI